MRLDRSTDYERDYADFEWRLPPTFNFAVDVVDAYAARQPDLPALIWVAADGREQSWTYARVSAATTAVAGRLAAAGIRAGDRVLVMLPRIPAWHITMVAALRIGAIPIPCVTMSTAADVEYRLRHSGAVAVVTVDSRREAFAGIADDLLRFCVEPAPGWRTLDPGDDRVENAVDRVENAVVGIDDPAILYYTSGSTGHPKGVLHSAGALYAWRNSAEYWLSLDPGDVIWCTADTGWAKAGTSLLFGPWSRGATVVFHDGPFDISRRFEILERLRVNCFCAAATELRMLVGAVDATRDLSALRLTVSAGEALDPSTVERWREATGSLVLDGYGQTETLMTVTNAAGMPVRPGSMGRPLPGVTVAVRTADGRIEEGAGSGELLIRSPNPQLLKEYYRDPERTAAGYVAGEGVRWWCTGDLVERDADGYVTYTGRTDDLINSAGYRIGPQEVENALLTHPAVLQAAVVGLPDPVRGEKVTAFVVLSPQGLADRRDDADALVADLQSHVRAATAPYKYPRAIHFVDDLPRTPTGKVRRAALRGRSDIPAASPTI